MSILAASYKLGTFSVAGSPPFPAMVIGDRHVYALHGLVAAGFSIVGSDSMIGVLAGWETNRTLLRDAASAAASGKVELHCAPIDALNVEAPLRPGNIICAAANYRNHVLEWFTDPEERAGWAKRLDERAASDLAFVFAKNTSSVAGPNDRVELPLDAQFVDWEVELVAVIGKQARRVSRADALDHVVGYTVGNDISARDFLTRDDVSPGLYDFFGSKSNPGFTPLGPFIVPAEFVPDPQNVHLRLRLNGDVMQDEGSDDMVDDVAKLISYASSRMTLNPGDIVMTGSPSGNAKKYNRYLKPGDVVEAEIDGIGSQCITFVAEGALSGGEHHE
jgi:2,4-didehydro-3-deoxy-L-rhamnonate hydrolase